VVAETALVGGAGGFWAGRWVGLTAAAAFLAGTAVLAVVAQAVVLLVARASPRRRLLADLTPAYVASLTLRPYQLDGRPAWYAANYTAWPRGHGYGAPLRERLSRLAAAEYRLVVIRPANPTLAGGGGRGAYEAAAIRQRHEQRDVRHDVPPSTCWSWPQTPANPRKVDPRPSLGPVDPDPLLSSGGVRVRQHLIVLAETVRLPNARSSRPTRRRVTAPGCSSSSVVPASVPWT
jgi:hypothetical protein